MAIMHRNIFINQSHPKNESIPVALGEYLKLQVYGDNFTIKISGIIDHKFMYIPTISINDLTLEINDIITEDGIYTISTAGYNRIGIELISGNNVNCTVSLH